MRYAIVKGGVVANVAEGNHPLTAEWKEIPARCPVETGDRYDGGAFYSPEGEMRMTPEGKMLFDKLNALEAAYKGETL